MSKSLVPLNCGYENFEIVVKYFFNMNFNRYKLPYFFIHKFTKASAKSLILIRKLSNLSNANFMLIEDAWLIGGNCFVIPPKHKVCCEHLLLSQTHEKDLRLIFPLFVEFIRLLTNTSFSVDNKVHPWNHSLWKVICQVKPISTRHTLDSINSLHIVVKAWSFWILFL